MRHNKSLPADGLEPPLISAVVAEEDQKMNDISADATTRQILSAIGKPVAFNYPEGESHSRGILRDRCVMPVEPRDGIPYWDVVDLIHFPEEQDADCIRVGYYRKSGGSLRWASQTTLTEPVRRWKALLIKAAREKSWFRQLLQEVVAEIGTVNHP